VRTARERGRDAIVGALVADAAAAGLHWVYDVEEVRRRGGEEPEFQPPEKNRYHARRKTGEFTHYGDHALVALESLAESGGFDENDYRTRFALRFGAEDYDGYLDHATRDTLATGKGADDNQAGCLVKLPALAVRHPGDPVIIEQAIRITHDNAEAVRYGLAAADAIVVAVQGASIREAVAGAAGEVLDADSDTTAYALAVGQACPVPSAVPVALHTALHASGYEDGVRRAILAGGDSAGRLFLTAALLGAAFGVPGAWLERVTERAKIERLTGVLLGRAGPD